MLIHSFLLDLLRMGCPDFDFFLAMCDRRGDVPDLTADPSLAEKELGFKAPQDLETMCKDLWNWQSKNPEGYGED